MGGYQDFFFIDLVEGSARTSGSPILSVMSALSSFVRYKTPVPSLAHLYASSNQGFKLGLTCIRIRAGVACGVGVPQPASTVIKMPPQTMDQYDRFFFTMIYRMAGMKHNDPVTRR
jgi:hypothetical protein